MKIELRPQPVGIFPFPASHLLLPQVAGGSGALQALLAGDADAETPPKWQFFTAAAQGNVSRALELLAGDDTPLAAYNRFVLAPGEVAYATASQRLSGDIGVLLDVAAYSCGVRDAVEQNFSLDGELLALALAASAAADLENQQQPAALAKLQAAIDAARDPSPLFAAVLIGQYADVMAATPGMAPALAMVQYREAIRLAGEDKLPMLRAELSMKLGMLLQQSANGQRGPFLEAINAYQSALHNGITVETHPELFAQLQNNLGLAYLSIPAAEASNQLRTGVAVQSFRNALKVYAVEKHPDMWASVSMNLANVLQYAPSSHPEQNLIQAVDIYEEVLQVRNRAKDPTAYALVLLNQANALAHLGVFKPALEKLAEAYKLFHWYEQPEQASVAQELIEQINERLGERRRPVELSAN